MRATSIWISMLHPFSNSVTLMPPNCIITSTEGVQLPLHNSLITFLNYSANKKKVSPVFAADTNI